MRRVFGGEGWIVVEAGVGDVVVDADGEVILGLRLLSFVEDGLDHRRREFLGGQAVAAADDARAFRGIACARAACLR